MNDDDSLKELKHHKQNELCITRPAYRQGRKLTAVKVYTINNESPHLYVYGVPSINLRSELKSLFDKYGQILKIHVVADVKTELFSECFHVHYQRIQSARVAKRFTDNKNFYGSVLHVCYAPEQESVEETRRKLFQRTGDVLKRLKTAGPLNDYKKQEQFKELDMSRLNRKLKRPALEITEERLAALDPDKIWKGVPPELDPRLPAKMSKMSDPVKHFQMSVPKGKVYGPMLDSNVSKDNLGLMSGHVNEVKSVNMGPHLNNLNFDQSGDLNIVNKLVPTQIVKSINNINNKRIIFRNKGRLI